MGHGNWRVDSGGLSDKVLNTLIDFDDPTVAAIVSDSDPLVERWLKAFLVQFAIKMQEIERSGSAISDAQREYLVSNIAALTLSQAYTDLQRSGHLQDAQPDFKALWRQYAPRLGSKYEAVLTYALTKNGVHSNAAATSSSTGCLVLLVLLASLALVGTGSILSFTHHLV